MRIQMCVSKLKRWQKVLEKNRLKIDKVKTELLELRFKNKVGRKEIDHNLRLRVQLINNMKKSSV